MLGWFLRALTWFFRGLIGGRVATRYPATAETMPEGFRGRPVVHPDRLDPDTSWDVYAEACLPKAIRVTKTELILDLGRCIACGLCAEVQGGAFTMEPDVELAVRSPEDLVTVVRRDG
jgi:formate hydrogenlyase subunit 6/NADH:ubiquinone oxidoreductase subunit I